MSVSSLDFATLLGHAARTRRAVHGPQPEPTIFSGQELAA